jgi:hypothetical protein
MLEIEKELKELAIKRARGSAFIEGDMISSEYEVGAFNHYFTAIFKSVGDTYYIVQVRRHKERKEESVESILLAGKLIRDLKGALKCQK